MKKSHKALTPRKQRLTIMGPLASKRHEAFCLEYMKDQNGSAAYKRAEYKPKNDDVAKANASRLLTNANVGVPQRIAELEAKYAAKVGFEIEDVLNRAHLADLVSLMHGPCRYCHGTNHAISMENDPRIRKSYQAAPVRARHFKALYHEANGRWWLRIQYEAATIRRSPRV